MKRISLLLIVALLSVTSQVTWGQVLLTQWTFTNPASTWGASPLAPTDSNANLVIGGLTRGSGLTTQVTSAGTAWGGAGYQDGISQASQTQASAIANGNFFTFTITAAPGFSVSLDNIAAHNIRRSASGPDKYIWQYSLDGTNFNDIGTAFIGGMGNTNSGGNPRTAVDLSGIAALQGVPSGTTITIRVPAWNALGDAGTFYFNGTNGNNLTINGTIASTPLPLDLITFKGNRERNVNHLEWITAQEQNVSHFELERGTDGRSFTKVAKINATGNNGTANNQYSYNDAAAAATSYYRLRMVDMDGSARYSNIVVLHDDAIISSRHLYPNPAESTLFIEGIAGKSTYRIMDVAGREIASHNTVTLIEGSVVMIDVAHLQQGIYFLQLSDDKGNETIRFIKK